MRFYLCESDSNRQSRSDQLKISNYGCQYVEELSRKCYSHYIIIFVDCMSIYYAINLDIVSSCMVFRYLYLGFIDILQV